MSSAQRHNNLLNFNFRTAFSHSPVVNFCSRTAWEYLLGSIIAGIPSVMASSAVLATPELMAESLEFSLTRQKLRASNNNKLKKQQRQKRRVPVKKKKKKKRRVQ